MVNKVINSLPFEVHLPGYQYCGPGTKLAKRLARGDPCINPLDAACKDHDIAYSQNREDVAVRNAADRELASRAWQHVFGKDAGIGEKAAALAVTNIMNVKTKLGMGLQKKKPISKKKKPLTKQKKKPTLFRKIVNAAKKAVRRSSDAKVAINSALRGAQKAVKSVGEVKNLRVSPIPSKVGGSLPLIPIFAGLSALGGLTGGAAGVAKAVNDVSAAKRQLEEIKRHNRARVDCCSRKGLVSETL